jgi:hypothetical protein
MGMRRPLMMTLMVGLGDHAARAQDNYEIQVYGSEMYPPGTTTLELHSNFKAEGRTTSREGVVPTNHAMHETLRSPTVSAIGLKPAFMSSAPSNRMGAGSLWVATSGRASPRPNAGTGRSV